MVLIKISWRLVELDNRIGASEAFRDRESQFERFLRVDRLPEIASRVSTN